jgi:RNA polymerase sigma factor (sigma-70 family)
MSDPERSALSRRFEENRRRLRSVAYRMLGSHAEAEDVVQEAWLRLSGADAAGIDNLSGWLTTVVARASLDVLRARRSGREQPAGIRFPDPMIEWEERGDATQTAGMGDDAAEGADPESEVMRAEAVSLALLVVLETLDPAERLAFVLHDTFDVPFDEIAGIIGKTPAAVRQLASRGRRRVQGAATPPDADMRAQREVVTAFLAAARAGDFDALLRVLDPEVVVRFDLGTTLQEVRGAAPAARNALIGARLSTTVRAVIVNGEPGLVSFDQNGEPRALLSFTVRNGLVAAIHGIADAARIQRCLASLR